MENQNNSSSKSHNSDRKRRERSSEFNGKYRNDQASMRKVQKRRLDRSVLNGIKDKKCKSPLIKCDDKGHIIVYPNDIIYSRYKIISPLGEGTFGRCFKCYDNKTEKEVALKVVRNVEKYRESAKIEVDILKEIHHCSAHKQSKLCIEILKWFEFQGHMCIVFPCLGMSVFDFMKHNNFYPFSNPQVQHISFQVASALEYLHSIKLTHTDLKPENVLFECSDYYVYSNLQYREYKMLLNSNIKIIDFGSATFEHDHHSKLVCTRHYRPPEVILELGWSYPVDMWGLGTMIYELLTGKAMFMTHDNLEHLIMMSIILGQIPYSLISQTKKKKYFDKHDLLHTDGPNVDHLYVREHCTPLQFSFDLNDHFYQQAYDLICGLLDFDPNTRLTAVQTLSHPFFKNFHCSFI